jgi:hypothetical protein
MLERLSDQSAPRKEGRLPGNYAVSDALRSRSFSDSRWGAYLCQGR